MLNNNSTNKNFVEYERLNYQAVEPKLTEPNMDETEHIIMNLKNSKAPREDDINQELLKLTGNDLMIETYLLVKDI